MTVSVVKGGFKMTKFGNNADIYMCFIYQLNRIISLFIL